MSKQNWTTNNIPDLTGKTIIVTGGNSGLGFESVKAFAEKGADVIMASRSLEKGNSAKEEIMKVSPKGSVQVMDLDLASLNSVKKFVKAFKADHKKLDILLNNAGIMMTPYFQTEDGFEGQLATNHLGHFALTGMLMDLLEATPKSRIVNVSSIAHLRGDMDFDNLQFENKKEYTPTRSYGRTKLSNLLFTYELQRKLEAAGKDVIATVAHPGISMTNLANHLINKWYLKPIVPLFKGMTQPPAMGALPQIRASVDPEVKGGQYYGPDGKKERKGFPVLVTSNEASHNKEDAKRLWEESERLTGVTFSI